MSSWKLVARSLVFHWRAHLGVVLGAVIGSAALIGALLVGDSMRLSLVRKALEAIGPFDYAINSADRFFTAQLAESINNTVRTPSSTNATSAAPGGPATCSSLLLLPGIAVAEGGSARANHVTVLGIDKDFLRLCGSATNELGPGQVLLNASLADQLRARPGAEILLRVPKPSSLSREVTLTERNNADTTLRLTVAGVLRAKQGGNFSLLRSQLPPMNAFVDRATLGGAVSLKSEANMLLARSAGVSGERLQSAVAEVWRLPDADLELRELPDTHEIELRSPRVFLETTVINTARNALPQMAPRPLLTYLANLIISGTNQTPYSFVTAAGPPYVSPDLREDEIVLNQWLADDLQAKPGDKVSLVYFLPESGASLRETTNTFTIRSLVPMELPWADRTLMPDFPGIEKAERTGDWQIGFELVYKIRPKDEDYWRARRGTPKAFVSAAAGQRMWRNRFGEFTALRWQANALATIQSALTNALLAKLRPADIGLRFEPIRDQALAGATQGQDFGQLFLGFSIFVVVAALLLVSLLFLFNVEQRMAEVGTLLAVGFTSRGVRRLFLWEGVALGALGAVIGAFAGAAYAQAMLWGLANLWRDAVGTSSLMFGAKPMTFVIGITVSTVVAAVAIWLALRKLGRQPVLELLIEGRSESGVNPRSRPLTIFVCAGTALAAIGIIVWAFTAREQANAGAFFGAGALLLIAGITGASVWLSRLARRTSGLGRLSMSSLAVRATTRRHKRSLATIGLLSCGCFLIAAVSAFRLDATRDAYKRTSGTGGFALVGESTLPIVQDLNTRSGREFFGLPADSLRAVRFVPLRVRAGDEASCLNLSRAQQPRLLGVNADLLAGRFQFSEVEKGKPSWDLLRVPFSAIESDEIPAIGDAASIQWALGTKVGATIPYTDEHGHAFRLRIVGAVANSILQGNLLIDEAAFVHRFPSEAGYRMLLVDAPPDKVAETSTVLTRALQDVGMELVPAAQRLNAFNAVQNTYLGAFQVLGGLGLLLGSAGLAIVVLRNVLERRAELGLLLAFGFSTRSLHRTVLFEHGALLCVGLGIGLVAAAIAVLPALLTSAVRLPYVSLSITLGLVLLNGLFWTWLATRLALRGDLVAALRNE